MFSDLKYAFRQFAKSPGFVMVAVLTLAVGIGENTAIFSVVNAVLLESLPYRESDRLVQVCEMPEPGAYIPYTSAGAFNDWQDQSTQLESIAAAHAVYLNLTGAGDPVRASGLEVTADYLRVFGINPVLGRDFLPRENASGGNSNVVILSYEFWQSQFGGDPAVIGRTIHLDEWSMTVIGVLPPHALFGNNADFLKPATIRAAERRKLSRDYGFVVNVVGRLKPGATMAQASEELTVGRRAIKSLYPVFKQKWTVGVRSLHEALLGDMRPYVLTLLGAVGLVLLIACANIANLLLAQATARQSEIAVRIALGATTGRIVRQLLTESLILALMGGSAGLLIGELSIKPLIAFAGIEATAGGAIGINVRILLFTLFVACATGLIFGIFPALSAARPNLNAHLKESVRGSTVGPRRHLQSLLLVSETALTVILLASTGLLLRSFVNALNSNAGFNPKNVLIFSITVPGDKVPTLGHYVRLGHRLMDSIAQIPGVQSTGIVTSIPMNGDQIHLGDLVSREDRPTTRNDFGCGYDSVAGDFFQTLGIPLFRGRFFTEADNREAAPRVMIVNELLAHTLFGDKDPLGQLLHFKEATWQIVGVVGNVRRYQLDYGPTAQIYFPQIYFPWQMSIVVRTKVPPLTLAPDVRLAVRAVDPDLPVANLTMLEKSVGNTLRVRRIMLALLGIFAGTALVLACVGIYGVIAYSVAQRTREVGIRIALGAQANRVVALVLGQGVRLVLLGLSIGTIGSLGIGLLIANQLYGVSKADPIVLTAVAFILLAVAAVACWIPARRASRVDPVVALRAE